ncbi:hypothetical protein [Leifsonia sp. WHRI 6310E]|uniref:hypothetical protein n=1 Tax=Leifsonia sp. WHRI 6310E TaxID=3162562 RepID=UPI0032EB4A25
MDAFPWPTLEPLPESVTAADALQALPGIKTEFWIGWSPPALGLVTLIRAYRPAVSVRLKQKYGYLRWALSGGTSLNPSTELDERRAASLLIEAAHRTRPTGDGDQSTGWVGAKTTAVTRSGR